MKNSHENRWFSWLCKLEILEETVDFCGFLASLCFEKKNTSTGEAGGCHLGV